MYFFICAEVFYLYIKFGFNRTEKTEVISVRFERQVRFGSVSKNMKVRFSVISVRFGFRPNRPFAQPYTSSLKDWERKMYPEMPSATSGLFNSNQQIQQHIHISKIVFMWTPPIHIGFGENYYDNFQSQPAYITSTLHIRHMGTRFQIQVSLFMGLKWPIIHHCMVKALHTNIPYRTRLLIILWVINRPNLNKCIFRMCAPFQTL